MPTRSGVIGRALTVALKDAQVLPRDAAAVAMLKRYARHLDEAQALADAADLIEPETDSQIRQLQRLRLKVDAQAVAAEIGPKFEKLLTALGMTLAGRAATPTKETPGGPVPGAAEFDELQARRADRQRAAAAVDAPAP